ncbi:MAG: 1-acyl-sn-glycerol-3-phosphate acyltransferase, partial [Oligoflexia bacterium]|nr:1-acyl-sn-glycerol-3-phosphate acyltransferase [Oligoflexia bacterium]
MSKTPPPTADYSAVGRAIAWVITPIYIALFFGILLVFHPLQVIAHRISYRAHMFILNLMNLCLITNFRLTGAQISFEHCGDLPVDRPLLIVSNHQSMYDIPLIIWAFRKHHPKFVAKKELGRGIPSISFALRHMGSVLIDRDNADQALAAIKQFGAALAQRKFSACIFPEGTRGRQGQMRPFRVAGFAALLESMPGAIVVPVVISGSWELVRYNLLPVPLGVKVRLRQLPQQDP